MDTYFSTLLVMNVLMASSLASLGLAVYMSNRHKKTNQLYFVNTLSVATWFIVRYFSSIDESMRSIWIDRLAIAISPFMGLTFYIFARQFINSPPIRSKLAKFALYAPAVLTLLLSQTSLYAQKTAMLPNHIFYFKIGPLYPFNTGYIAVLIIAGCTLIFKKIKTTKEKAVINGLWAVIIGMAVALVVNVAVDVYLIMIRGNTTSQRHTVLSFTGFMIYALSVMYAIVRHGLFSIKRTFARLSAYILVIICLTAVYASLVTVLVSVLFDLKISVTELMIFSLAITLVAFSLPVLKQFFNKLTYKVFYQYVYDMDQVLNELSDILVKNLELDIIFNKSLEQLSLVLSPEYVQAFTCNQSEVQQWVRPGTYEPSKIDPRNLVLLNSHKFSVITLDDTEDEQLRDYMQNNHVALIAKLSTDVTNVGFIQFGRRMNGGNYSDQDTSLLSIYAKNLSLAVENAQHYEEIKSFATTLENEVNRATHKLTKSNQKLKEMSHTKDEFISMASHQLLPQLTSITGLVDVINASPEQQEEILTIIKSSATRMSSLVSDMLTVSKIENGALKLNFVRTDLVSLVANEIANLKLAQSIHDVRVRFNHPIEAFVNIDPTKYREVIFNLIENAILYSYKNSEVFVSINTTARGHTLLISDSGIGIPREEISKLFSNYFRASNARQKRPTGTGLGLYVCKRIVGAHGHSIRVKSTLGKSTSITLYIE